MMDEVLPIELRAVFRLALRSKDEIDKFSQDGPRLQNPIVKEIIQSILYSRRFVPRYLIVLVLCVLGYGAAFGIRAACRRSKPSIYHSNEETGSSIASSSSSTLQGSETPPHKSGSTENSPLLKCHNVEGQEARSWSIRTWHSIQAWLLYRPKPIPALTARKNNLPANNVSITIIAFLALNLFYMFYNLPMKRDMVFAIADRAGLLFAVNLPVLYILAAKNNRPLQWITKWSYEGLNIFHRRLGEWMTISAVIHAIGMVVAFYDLIAPAGFTLWWYLTRKIIIFGVVAFICYSAIYFNSIGSIRESLYEFFLISHIFLQITALVMLFLHHHDARPYVGAALAIWTLDRVVGRILCKTRSSIATLEVAVDGRTILLHTEIKLKSTRIGGLHNGWHAGQHCFLTIPSMGTKYRFQSHPFTIASPAPPESYTGEWTLQLTIRAQAGFSRDLLEYAKLHQHVEVSLDGPYSSSEVLDLVMESDRVCLIAGGSGIAVTYPYAWVKQAPSSSQLIWTRPSYLNGQKIKPNIKMSELSNERNNFAHFWIRQEPAHDSWICTVPQGLSPDSDLQSSTKSVINTPASAIDLITHRFSTRNNGQHQRPDIQGELEAWIRQDKHQDMKHQRICVVVSGPDGLIRDVQNAVAALSKQGFTNLIVRVEAFGW